METQKSSRIAVIFGIFAAIFPLTFSFSDGETSYLISSPLNVASCFLLLGIALFLIIRSRRTISSKKMMAMAILYILVPLSFRFSESGLQFLILKQAPFLSATMIVTGCVLFISLLKDPGTERRRLI